MQYFTGQKRKGASDYQGLMKERTISLSELKTVLKECLSMYKDDDEVCSASDKYKLNPAAAVKSHDPASRCRWGWGDQLCRVQESHGKWIGRSRCRKS